MHCFFHLVNADATIVDDTGVDVASLAAARALALEAIQDLKRENAEASDGWEGWSLTIADASGCVLLSISLGEATERYASSRQGHLVN